MSHEKNKKEKMSARGGSASGGKKKKTPGLTRRKEKIKRVTKSKPKRKLKSKKPTTKLKKEKGSVKKFKIEEFCNKCYSGLLNCCNQVTRFYEKNKNDFLATMVLVVVMALFAQASMAPSCQQNQNYSWSKTYTVIVQESVKDTVEAYSAMLQPVGNLMAKTFAGTGEVMSQTRNYKFALAGTVQAYAAVFQPVGRSLTEVFIGSGKVLAVVSYAVSLPARVMAKTMP